VSKTRNQLIDCLYSQADIDTLRAFFAQVHGRQETFLFHDCVCRFESERLVVRQLTTVAYRLQSVRIVSLTYRPDLTQVPRTVRAM